MRTDRSKHLEIYVLRTTRCAAPLQVDRLELTDNDRTLLAAIAAALRRTSRAGWLRHSRLH